jgi:hypothetical protein
VTVLEHWCIEHRPGFTPDRPFNKDPQVNDRLGGFIYDHPGKHPDGTGRARHHDGKSVILGKVLEVLSPEVVVVYSKSTDGGRLTVRLGTRSE